AAMKHSEITRRRWLAGTSASAAAAIVRPGLSAQQTRPKVAAIFTELRFRSHAYNILSNLMGRYLFRGEWLDTGVDVISFYADQFPEGDMAREASERLK